MEVALKQRLVGAAVIIALGIIIIPMILDGAGERQLRKMPQAPEVGQTIKSGFIIQNKQEIKLPVETATVLTEAIPESTLPAKVTAADKPVKAKKPESSAAKPVKIPVKSAVKEVKVTKNKPVAKSVPMVKTVKASKNTTNVLSWVVQVGSFTDSRKAFGLRDKLRKKHYKSFVEQIRGRSGQKMYRVRIGPVAKRSQADVLSKKLKKEGVKSFVTRHP